jgi:glycerol-3-phosphate dehydrogenase
MMELIKAPLVLRVSIAFYDLLAGKHKIGRHRIMNRTEILGMEPMLNPIRLKGGAIYWDAFGLDFRLTLAVIKKAEGYGARCLNYAELLEFRREKNVIVAGVRDNLSDRKFRIFARKVVIATGPWLDRVRAKANMERMLKPTKGSHIIVSRSKLNIRNAVVMEAIDARLTFAIPWDSIVIVGTTEIDYANPDRVRATKEEVDYLLEVANRYFRSAELRYEDIITTYSGIRPLVDGKDSDISREHRVVEDDGIIFIGGGKLTTYRLMAKDVVDRVAQQSSKCITHLIQLKDFNIPSNFEEDIGKHLAEVYAKEEIDGIRQLIQENWHLGKRILPDQPFIWAEVNHAVEKEFALKLSDVLIRRLGLHFKMSLDLDVIRQIAEHMGMLLGWNAEQIENEVEDYLKEVRKNMEWKKEIQE